MKTNYFIVNYEEQYSYLERKYSSAKKSNRIVYIIAILTTLFCVGLGLFIDKNKYPYGLMIASIVSIIVMALIQCLFRNSDENIYKGYLDEIKISYTVHLQEISNNKYKYFIDSSNENDFISRFVQYSKGYLCNDFQSFQNGTVNIQDNAEPVWNESEEGKIKYKKIIDLSDYHILSLEEIQSHSYKDIKEGEK